MKLNTMLFISVLFISICGQGNAQVLLIERNALITFYNSTNGDSWNDKSGWKTPPLEADGFATRGTECGWFGVYCNSQDNVNQLNFGNNGLDGSIPSDLEDLSSLRYLFFYENNLSENIPSTLGNLSDLRSINFSGNQLSGNIPEELGVLTNLTYLDLSSNNLDGPIPSVLGNLIELTHLYLGDNDLTGIIPSGLGNLTKLNWFGLSSNELTGGIPSTLGKLVDLIYLNFSWNHLNGKISPDFGNFSKLETLSLSENQLEGSLPADLGYLGSLKLLYLENNNFWGCIPSNLGNCDSLEILNISSNHFSGQVPPEIMNLTALLDNQSDFRENHIETSDVNVKNFLDQKQDGGVWENYQSLDTTIPHVEPNEVCGGYTPCHDSIAEAIASSTTPSVILVAEGEYRENVVIENGFSLEMTWTGDFSCDAPTDAVIISGPLNP